jgi:hypothetical protein
MLAPDGTLLCRCHFDKVEWYVSRGLADIVEQEPHLAIRLRFQPKGMGNAGNPFYTGDKQNRCVVCGSEGSLTKHHCVPACFRKCMPIEYKENTSHDILPLCATCHMEYEPEAWQLKEDIARRYGVLFQPNVVIKSLENGRWKAWKAASALKRFYDRIPPARREELYQAIREYLGKEIISTEDIEALFGDNVCEVMNPNGSSEAIMKKVQDLDAFIREWRQHFVDVMKPQFLPPHWSVDFKTRREA